MASAAAAGDMPVFDLGPGLDLALMATDAATALASRDVGCRVVVQPMGRGRRTMRMVIEIIAGMAGGAGVRGDAGFADDGVACGNASQGDGGNNAAMAGRAGVVAFRAVGIDQER